MYELCCISGVCVCILWCRMLCPDACFLKHIVYIYIHTLGVDACIAWRCMSYVCDAHYVYVHMVEEKTLGDCQVWKLI